ncbi:MAG: hypothetical protein AAF526_01090 [Pseudomonadota bacterium]
MTATKRILHIHAGLPKTGTSALQRFLALNRDVLAARGLVVPEADLGDRGDHHELFYALGGISPLDRRLAVRRLVDWMEQQGGDTFLISSEFAYLMLRFGFARHGFQALQSRGFSIKFHLFVRPQTDFAVSAYPEFLRNLLFPQGFGAFVDVNFLPFARDYGDIANRLRTVSSEQVGLLPYTQSDRKSGIWWSLLGSLGTQISEGDRFQFEMPGQVNQSLGPVGVAALTIALRKMDRRKLAHRWGLRRALRKTVLRVTGNFPPETDHFNPMTRRFRSELWDACRKVNDPLAQMHWGQPWDEVFFQEHQASPKFNIYRRYQDDPESKDAKRHDRQVYRLLKKINETRREVAAARAEFSLIRWLGSPLDRLADRAMHRIVKGG